MVALPICRRCAADQADHSQWRERPQWPFIAKPRGHLVKSAGNASGLIDTSVPGPDLSDLGYQQAATVANQLRTNGYDGVYASTMVRAQETAAIAGEVLGCKHVKQTLALLPDASPEEIWKELRREPGLEAAITAST